MCDHGLFCAGYYEEEKKPMDYLKLAREAHECAQEVQDSPFRKEYRREAEVCALIAIAEQLKKLNESLGNLHYTAEACPVVMSYVPQV